MKIELIKNFNAYELIDPVTYSELVAGGLIEIEVISDRIVETKINPRLVNFFRKEMLEDLLTMRKMYGVLYINNWHLCKKYMEAFKIMDLIEIIDIYESNLSPSIDDAGTRHFYSKTGKPDSMHRFRCAFDIKAKNLTADELRKDVLAKQKVFNVKRVEDDVNWLHIDYMETGKKEIVIFKP